MYPRDLTENVDYSLYQFNRFYEEVKYNGGINAITKFTSFCTLTKLEPYLDKIDISKVIGLCIPVLWSAVAAIKPCCPLS